MTVLVIILESRHLSEYPAHDEEDDVHEKHPVLKAYYCLNLPLPQLSDSGLEKIIFIKEICRVTVQNIVFKTKVPLWARFDLKST